MNFNLNPEQQLLQDSVRRYIDKAYSFDERATMLKEETENCTRHWQAFSDNGWLAAALPEEYGGLGGTLLDTALIAQQFGRGLVIEPYLGCAVLAAQTLVAAAGTAQKDRLVPGLADGSIRLALAYSEPASRGDPAVVSLTATPNAGGYLLDGRKTLVLGADEADGFIVSARITAADGKPGAEGDTAISLFLVDAASPCLSREILALHDGSGAGELVFDRLQVSAGAMLGTPGSGLPALQHGLAHAIIALCAELIGGMERAIEITAEYLKIRKQFAVPLASFQALQHRMADMAAELELSRSMLYALLASVENDDDAARQHTISQAKFLIGRAARFVCGQAIQLHGGIGMTEEYTVGHFFKRAVVADVLFGNSDQHEAACAAALQHTLRPGHSARLPASTVSA
ncbi:acyl-CoA dehydrogenase [Cupriavidus sp. DF5525]|uniref:acyl-CoA dehydrogenase family protein n=1 Tax=Cupriavidus sp. DF5525 TaxID=3160989 RepID=UPI0032DE4A2F